jgi:hypothetical protein
MSRRAEDIAQRIQSFSDEVVAFDENLSEDDVIIFRSAAQHFDSMKTAVGG